MIWDARRVRPGEGASGNAASPPSAAHSERTSDNSATAVVDGTRSRARPSRDRLAQASKRLLDLVVATTLLAFLSPLIASLALAIKLETPGPVFYRCRRVGRRGAELAMLKFRKMRDDAAGLPLTLTCDARLTRVGRFLARTKLDELPQLW